MVIMVPAPGPRGRDFYGHQSQDRIPLTYSAVPVPPLQTKISRHGPQATHAYSSKYLPSQTKENHVGRFPTDPDRGRDGMCPTQAGRSAGCCHSGGLPGPNPHSGSNPHYRPANGHPSAYRHAHTHTDSLAHGYSHSISLTHRYARPHSDPGSQAGFPSGSAALGRAGSEHGRKEPERVGPIRREF